MKRPLSLPSQRDIRFRVGCAFLVLQVLLVVEARFHDGRHFCWAPHTSMVYYRLSATKSGINLTNRQLEERYHIEPDGWEAHSYQNLLELIEQAERQKPPDQRVEPVLRYSVNGAPEVVWTLP